MYNVWSKKGRRICQQIIDKEKVLPEKHVEKNLKRCIDGRIYKQNDRHIWGQMLSLVPELKMFSSSCEVTDFNKLYK